MGEKTEGGISEADRNFKAPDRVNDPAKAEAMAYAGKKSRDNAAQDRQSQGEATDKWRLGELKAKEENADLYASELESIAGIDFEVSQLAESMNDQELAVAAQKVAADFNAVKQEIDLIANEPLEVSLSREKLSSLSTDVARENKRLEPIRNKYADLGQRMESFNKIIEKRRTLKEK